MAVSAESKHILRYLRSTIGDGGCLERFYDENEQRHVDILNWEDIPTAGILTYSTVGLSDADILLVSGETPIRIEIIMALENDYKYGPHMLSSCSFAVFDRKILPRPGSLFPHLIDLYPEIGCRLNHIMLVYPFLWKLDTQELSTRTVEWLQAIPISEEEMSYAIIEGSDALEDMFVDHQINVFDLKRPSVI